MNVAFDALDPRRLASFSAAVTAQVAEFDSDEVVRLHAPDERGVRRLVFWRVPEPKQAKTRKAREASSGSAARRNLP